VSAISGAEKINRQMAVEAAEAAAQQGPGPTEFLNRELSWLEFNQRVLHEAMDERTPLLERVNFLAIFSSNLDEFFMKRVGGLKRQVAAGVVTPVPDGLPPVQQLAAIRKAVLPMLVQQADCYTKMIRPALAEHHVFLLDWEELSDPERDQANRYFQSSVFPVLTPLAVDPGHPFPFISNLSLSLGVTLRHPQSEENLFARIKVPQVLPAWVRLDGEPAGGGFRFVRLIDVIRHNLEHLFPGMRVLSVMPFRITRNADVDRDEEDAEDLLAMIEEELRRRRFEQVVRLEHGPDPDPWLRQMLADELHIIDSDIYESPALIDYNGLRAIADLQLPRLRYKPFTPVVPVRLGDEEADIFAAIRSGDILLHHPYESFTASVERFIRTAASDPDVLAIKMTVYRTGDESPFIQTLIRAAESGKQVACLVELKARFDEERNIYWAHMLEKAGVHVVYGLVGLKTHCKVVLVVRREPQGLCSYVHIGTGNYNVQTARLYTDFGLLTCRPELTEDAAELFNYLTGRSARRTFRKLLVAPINLQERLLEMIDRESSNALSGRPAQIVGKMNNLQDRRICQALHRASQAGVPIDLIVRGICCLRPGVPGLSENIRVISVIGRLLEHSRIFFFRNAAEDPLDGEFYIGSADWMYRNLLARVEAVTPIEDRPLREKCWETLQVMLADQRQAWQMQSDGTYVQRMPGPQTTELEAMGSQQALMELTRRRHGTAEEPVTRMGEQ
jgi:polyphosphate kinase